MVLQESVFITTCSEKCILKGTVSYGGPEGQSSGPSLNRSSQSSGSSLNRSSQSVLMAEYFICLFNFNHKALVYDAIHLLHKLQ